MHKFIIASTMTFFVLLGGTSLAFAQVETTTTVNSQTKIQELLKLIAELQQKLQAARAEVAELSQDLGEGAEGDDVRLVQELLATDPTIFNVAPTGFFGTKTKEALMKFQERYELEVTGRLDEATREVIKELRKESVVPGLLRSEEARERVKERLQVKWKDCDFTLPFRASACEKIKVEIDEDKDDDDSDSDDVDNEASAIKEARIKLAIVEARLNRLERILDRREYDKEITNMLVDRAQDRVDEAQKKLREAKKQLQSNPDEAVELLEEADELVDEGAESIDEEAEVEEAGDEAEAEAEEEDIEVDVEEEEVE